jgi:hypothetical protein
MYQFDNLSPSDYIMLLVHDIRMHCSTADELIKIRLHYIDVGEGDTPDLREDLSFAHERLEKVYELLNQAMRYASKLE